MSALFLVIERCNILLKKYGQYLQETNDPSRASNDPIEIKIIQLEDKVFALEKEADGIQKETSRSEIAARNAAIRRKKQVILSVDVMEIKSMLQQQQQTAKDKEGAQTPSPDSQYQIMYLQKMGEIVQRCEEIPDGTIIGQQSKNRAKEFIELTGINTAQIKNESYYTHTEETKLFEQQWQEAKKKQDRQLDRIERGVDDLKGMAQQIGEEVNRQNMFVDEIDQQVDKVQAQLQSNNQRLKDIITKTRGCGYFCVDITLIIVLLAVGAYIYYLVRK